MVLRDPTRRITIYFDNFSTEKRDELKAFYREGFSHDIQEGWDGFAQMFAPPSPARLRMAGYAAIAYVLIAGLCLVAGLYVWIIGKGSHFFLAAIVNAICTVALVRGIRKKQRIAEEKGQSPDA